MRRARRAMSSNEPTEKTGRSFEITSVDLVAIFRRPSTPLLLQDEPTVTGCLRFVRLRVGSKGRVFPRQSRFAFPTSDRFFWKVREGDRGRVSGGSVSSRREVEWVLPSTTSRSSHWSREGGGGPVRFTVDSLGRPVHRALGRPEKNFFCAVCLPIVSFDNQ